MSADTCPLGHILFGAARECIQCAHEASMDKLGRRLHQQRQAQRKRYPCGHVQPPDPKGCPKCRRIAEDDAIREAWEIEQLERSASAAAWGRLSLEEAAERQRLAAAEKARFRARHFPGGRVPNVHEIPITSGGLPMRFVICPPGMTPASQRKRRRRR